jgi:endo-alpha-1,4-polygalactosaminidase (GH114 family)
VTAALGLQPSGLARAGEMKLADVRSWAYQLQNVDPLQVKSSPYDLLVIDYGFAKHQAATFPREIIDLMRRKPDGSRRFIFAYLSIGEAEDYRYYWQDSWTREHPQWLDARARDKGFLVIAQNGDRLLSDPRFRAAIDGFAREDLLYGENREGNRNPRSSIIESVARLSLIAQAHKPVLVVEYPRDPALDNSLAEEINSLGFLPYLTRRELNSLASAPFDGAALEPQAPSQ